MTAPFRLHEVVAYAFLRGTRHARSPPRPAASLVKLSALPRLPAGIALRGSGSGSGSGSGRVAITASFRWQSTEETSAARGSAAGTNAGGMPLSRLF